MVGEACLDFPSTSLSLSYTSPLPPLSTRPFNLSLPRRHFLTFTSLLLELRLHTLFWLCPLRVPLCYFAVALPQPPLESRLSWWFLHPQPFSFEHAIEMLPQQHLPPLSLVAYQSGGTLHCSYCTALASFTDGLHPHHSHSSGRTCQM